MEIKLQGQNIRLATSDTFVDISEPDNYQNYAHQIEVYPSMHYVVLLKFEDRYSYSMVIFKDVNWFKEWFDKQDNVQIIKVLTPTPSNEI